MKKYILQFILVLQGLFLALSFNFYTNANNFSSNKVINHIEYLSSENLKGRLAGTLENTMVEQYIKSQFIKYRLKDFNGSYLEKFTTLVPITQEGSPHLLVKDSRGNIEKSYKYGMDYKEDLVNFKTNNVVFNNKNPLYIDKNFLQVKVGKDPFLFYVPEGNELKFRSSFFPSSNFNLYIMIKDYVFKEIEDYLSKGYTIDCFIPMSIGETSINNVLGVIKGYHKNQPPLIVSAHFDHIGSDLQGTIYRGALDNASGTAFLLELSRYLNTLGFTPRRDIIFIGFNGEELGCIGSRAFVDNNSSFIQGAKVYNLDMIGSNEVTSLAIMGGKGDTEDTELIRTLKDKFSEKEFDFHLLFEDASDHEYFRKNNIEAITFCQDDMTRIHTPEDTVENISKASIEKCFDIITLELINQSFPLAFIIINSKLVFLSTLLTIIIDFLILFIVKPRSSNFSA